MSKKKTEGERERKRFTCVASVHLRQVLLGKPHCSFKPASHCHGNTQTPAGLCQTYCPCKGAQARCALSLSLSLSFTHTQACMSAHTHYNKWQHTTNMLHTTCTHTSHIQPHHGCCKWYGAKSHYHSGWKKLYILPPTHSKLISCINSIENEKTLILYVSSHADLANGSVRR